MDLTSEARLVAGGHHRTHTSNESCVYSSIALCDSILRIAFTLLVALNNFDVQSLSVNGAYLSASLEQNVYTTTGLE